MDANKGLSGSGGQACNPSPLAKAEPRASAPARDCGGAFKPDNPAGSREARDLGTNAHYHNDSSSSKAPAALAALRTARAAPLAEAVERGVPPLKPEATQIRETKNVCCSASYWKKE